jgi:glucose uptake protein
MVLPTTYLAALSLLIVSLVCWGSWANTLKLAGPHWRFELFCVDYALGVVLLSVVAAFTFGTLGSDLTFSDHMLVAGRMAQIWVFAGGVIFNLANMLFVAAISLAGLSVAFPLSIGLALIIGVIWNYALSPQGNPALLFGGVAVVFIAILVDAAAYRARDRAGASALNSEKRKPVTTKGLVVSVIAGIFMGAFYPLVEKGMPGDLGLGPYASMLIFSFGVLLSTFVFNIYFMNLPIAGQPIPWSAYFRGTLRQHLLGIIGGVVWAVGTLTNFLAASTPAEVNVGPALSLAIGQGGTLVSVLWGVLVWKEFAGADAKAKRLLGWMFALFVGGIVLLSLVPLFH